MVTISVPATTANIGPGFDSLGIALSLYTKVTFELDDTLTIQGCDVAYQNKDNLIVQSFKKTAQHLGKEFHGVNITIKSDIPVTRGLGSSAACITAGIMGANALYHGNLNKYEMFDIANQMEGHPDNVAPAIFGSMCASFLNEGKPYMMKYDVAKALHFIALIPDFELSTRKAREVLPSQLSYQDAVYNISRCAAVCKAIETNNQAIMRIAIQDRLHEPYRSQLIEEYDEIKAICFKHNAAAFYISGGGPTLMSITDHESFIYDIMDEISCLKHKWDIRKLHVDRHGATIENQDERGEN